MASQLTNIGWRKRSIRGAERVFRFSTTSKCVPRLSRVGDCLRVGIFYDSVLLEELKNSKVFLDLVAVSRVGYSSLAAEGYEDRSMSRGRLVLINI